MVLQTALDIGFRSYTLLVQAHTHPFFQIVLPSRGVPELDIAGRGGAWIATASNRTNDPELQG